MVQRNGNGDRPSGRSGTVAPKESRWKKGQSGNPKGTQSKGMRTVRDFLQEMKRKGSDESNLEALVKRIYNIAMKDDERAIAAFTALWDRAYGRPAQAVAVEQSGPVRIVIEREDLSLDAASLATTRDVVSDAVSAVSRRDGRNGSSGR